MATRSPERPTLARSCFCVAGGRLRAPRGHQRLPRPELVPLDPVSAPAVLTRAHSGNFFLKISQKQTKLRHPPRMNKFGQGG